MHSLMRPPVLVLAATALFAATAGCGDSGPSAADPPAAPSAATIAEPQSTPTAPPGTDPAAETSSPPDHDEIVEALVLTTVDVPARLTSLTASADALWAAGDGGTVVRIAGDPGADPVIDDLTVEDVEGTLRPTFTDDSSWWAETGGSMIVQIDPASLAVESTVDVGPPVGDVLVGPDGQLWIEATQPPAGLRPFDPSTSSAGDVVVLAESDEVVGTATAAGSLWAPVFGSNEILRLDPDLTVVDTVSTGVGPTSARPVGNTIWWTNRIDGTLERVDIESGETTTVDLNQVAPVELPSAIVSTGDDIWLVAATIADRTGVIFRVDAVTGEIVAARTLPGGRSVDELGGLAALDDRLFVLFSTTGELAELDVGDFTTVTDPDRPTPTTEPMSADETEIRAVMATLFSSDTSPDAAVSTLENGDELGDVYSQFRQFFTDNFDDQEVAAEVFGVRVDGDTAEVDYVVTVSGGPIVDQQVATLSRGDDGWQVAEQSFCDLVALGQIACP